MSTNIDTAIATRELFCRAMSICAVSRLRRAASWVAPQDGFMPVVADEGIDFVAARLAAHRCCSQQLQAQVAAALRGLNEAELEKVAGFLREATRRLQRAWAHDAAPPYVEVPAALVHTGCNSADLPLVLKQLQRSMRVDCSPHVAVLHSKDCTSLLAATRSLVSQLIGNTARIAPGCSFDLDVLAGWHTDLCAGRVAARARQAMGAALRDEVHEQSAAWTPLVVIIEDAEHFGAETLNDLIYACASVRSADGAPLPLCFVFALSSGVAALHRLLHRSSLILLRGMRFALASTERTLDQIIARLLCSPMLPQLGAAAYASLLDAISEQHGSTTAFVRQLDWLLLRHFRTHLLAFLVPLEPYVPPQRGSSAVRSAKECLGGVLDALGPAQLRALLALPSVSAALPSSSSGSRTEREDSLREALPRWLCEIVSARRCRAASVACALALLALAFPGANRTVTAPRQLYLELLLGPAHRTLELQGARRTALQLALDKCRERVSGSDALAKASLRALLVRCCAQLRQTAAELPAPSPGAAAPLDGVLAELDGLLAEADAPPHMLAAAAPGSSMAAATGTAVASSAVESHSAVESSATSAAALAALGSKWPAVNRQTSGAEGVAKRRRMALGAAAAVAAARPSGSAGSGGASGGEGMRYGLRVAMWFERLLREHTDRPSTMPLHEIWECDAEATGGAASAATSTAGAAAGTIEVSGSTADGLAHVFGAVPQRALEDHMKAIIAEARRAHKPAAGPACAAVDKGVPLRSFSPRGHASTDERAAAERQAAERRAAEAKAEQRRPGKSGAIVTPKAPLPSGWSTALASEVLMDFPGRKVCAVEWFTAFQSNALAKRSGEDADRLLARFVVATNDLQMLGFVSPSKRPRGTFEKRVHSG